MAPSSVDHTGIENPSSPVSPNNVHTAHKNSALIDLYSVRDGDKMWETLSQKEVPFIHWLLLHGPQGEVVRVKALFDRGAMVGAMCTSFFKKIQL